MLNALKNLGRAVIPKSIFRAAQPYYHGAAAVIASYYYGRPSKKLAVIGITGTAGKSTTVNLLAAIFNSAERKAGFITTANYSDGNTEYVNKHGLSMPGGFMLQRQLRAMVNNGCRYAIIEATSEGLAQNRHLGVEFNAVLLTTLAPAHLDAHGSFENYRAAKGKLFTAWTASEEEKLLGVNLDTQDSMYFLNFPAGRKFGVTLKDASSYSGITTYKPVNIVTEPELSFSLNGVKFQLGLIGEFNVYNAVLAAACANMLDVELQACADALRNFRHMAGRMEKVPNNRNIQIFVDYAPEPPALENALRALDRLPHGKVIHVFGSTGGHRDVGKRFDFGKISGQRADIIIITNDDVYDSDPELIARNIREGIDRAAPKKVQEVLTILDRRQAIRKALELAQPNDIIMITGKGSEQFLVLPGNKRIAWDEPTVVQEELQKL
jgi:UDP-N-acetylmuramoyl-L-alanyl-D-glutamate--2,6-diaminopimelate ligase